MENIPLQPVTNQPGVGRFRMVTLEGPLVYQVYCKLAESEATVGIFDVIPSYCIAYSSAIYRNNMENSYCELSSV